MGLELEGPTEAGMASFGTQRIADLAKSWVDQSITPALVVIVARKGTIVLHQAFGQLAPDPDSPPVQIDSIFPLSSLTKPVTATAAMVLVGDGLLGLNRPVQWYIPEFTGEGKDSVMVHHLLTHTSGLRDEELMEYAVKKNAGGRKSIPSPDPTANPFVHKYLRLRCDGPLTGPPGTEMRYCTFN